MYIPEKIKNMIGDQEYQQNEVGMSASEVLVFPEYVLKIQEQSQETDSEKQIVDWIDGKVSTPKIPEYIVEDHTAYTLMTKMSGKMLCDDEYMRNPELVIKLVADGLRQLWKVDVSDCPCKASLLANRLKQARYNVENGLVDVDNVEPETFGPNGFASPIELLEWLENNCPEEDIVLTHGDFCMPNIFIENDKICGFIDLGKMGPADRWQDIAIALRSLHHNFNGKYNNRVPYFNFEPNLLLNELGIEMDERKNRYYVLLDELF